MIRTVSLAITVFSVSVLAACSAISVAHMKVDPALANNRLTVSTSDLALALVGKGSLRFGDYAATSIDRSLGRGSSLGIQNLFQRSRVTQDYGFVFMAHGTTSTQAMCQTGFSENAIPIAGLTEPRNSLRCEFTAGDRTRGKLRMSNGKKDMSGRMTYDEIEIQIAAVFHLEGARFDSPDPVGYDLRINGTPIAAVPTTAEAVWLDRSAPAVQQEAAALTAAALLLYYPVQD